MRGGEAGRGLLFPYFAAAAGALSRKIICENSVRPSARPATFKMTHELRPGIFFCAHQCPKIGLLL